MTPFAPSLTSPFYAVIFTNQRREDDENYEATAIAMRQLAEKQAGFLGYETARDANGFGITVSYWDSPESIQRWRNNAEHAAARHQGNRTWYSHYELRVAKVERAYGKKPA